MMRGSNMGVPPYWLIILLITWGLGHVWTIATPLGWLKATKESHLGAWSCLNHRYTSWLAQGHERKVTWGLGCIQTIATPLGWLKSHDSKSLGGLVVFNHRYTFWLAQCHYLGAKECCQEQLKHRHPLSTAQNVAWGFFAIAMNKEIYTCNRLSSRGLEAWYIHLI